MGIAFSATAGWLTAVSCLALLLIHQLWHASKFTALLLSPSYGEVPVAMGIWGEIYYRLHKLVKGWRDQVLEVEHQHQRFIQAIQASPNGVVMLNEDDQIEWCNAIAEKHFGLNARRDAMQRITHILRKPAFVQYIIRQNYREPVKLTGMGDFEQFSLEVQIFPYGDKQKLVLSQDISQIEKTDAMRRDFVANVSHELKTPLFTIQGYLLTLLDGAMEDKNIRTKYLERAEKGVERLIYIVKDLDMITKLEVGEINLDVTRFNIVEVIQNVFDLFEMKASNKNITLTFDSRYSKPIWVMADQEKIQQIVTNLVVNSIKYGKKGGTTEVSIEDLINNKVIVRITDNGEGIEKQNIPRLFERFYRVDKSGARSEGGSGLGLAIVKHIIEGHDEKIYVESQIGVGSEFSFTLEKTK